MLSSICDVEEQKKTKTMQDDAKRERKNVRLGREKQNMALATAPSV